VPNSELNELFNEKENYQYNSNVLINFIERSNKKVVRIERMI
jgi:hypothetical protein